MAPTILATNVKELIKRKKPKNWIIDQIAAKRNLVLLAGESGSGKTSLCYSMADAIAKGDLFLNTFQTKKQKVAFIQADESETNCADKLETMGIDSDITFYFSDTFEKLTVDELPKFQDWVDKHDYDVVFLPPLQLVGGRGAGRGDWRVVFGFKRRSWSSHTVWHRKEAEAYRDSVFLCAGDDRARKGEDSEGPRNEEPSRCVDEVCF